MESVAINRVLDWIFKPLRLRYQALATKNDLDNLYRQFAALLEVREYTEPGAGPLELRGWAISPDALAEVLFEINTRSNPIVVEFGAGSSTTAIAASLRRLGGGRLLSFEHNPEYAEHSMKRIKAAGLAPFVEMRVVNIEQIQHPSGLKYNSYALDEQAIRFDVALVDGPTKGVQGQESRLAPLEWCIKNASPHSVIFLDDADRPGEKRLIELLKKEYPKLTFQKIAAEKGLMRITISCRNDNSAEEKRSKGLPG